MSATYRFPQQFNQSGIAATAPVSMSTQRFCLRWNNHQSNLLSVFDQLLHDESFVDVTLAVEGQLLKAHKMVLSACSPYFQALFVNHPDKHPIVILKDVPYSDMKSLLDFMYRGEVSVDQDRLTAFLRVAECLRIKGLTEVNEEKCDSITSSLANQNSSSQNNQQKLQPLKKFNSMNMLGYALMQPKRKRGRPRKLSGSSNGTPGADDFDKSDNIVQGSPEMLEVKMGMDGFTGNNSDSSSGNKDKDDDDAKSKQDLKQEGEPVAGTSTQEQNSSASNDVEFQASDEITDYLENNQNHSNLPTLPQNVTLELIPAKYHQESVIISTEVAKSMLAEPKDSGEEYEKMDHESESLTGVHFLTDDDIPSENFEKRRHELLEYITREDGSVICKLCGELLASRTHWYRHKYKFHVTTLVNPAPLFKCKHCNVFFKSRKGYMGHIATRHSESAETTQEELNISVKEEVVETSEVPKIARKKEIKDAEWEEQRIKEEKLVAAIIDRVRKECEAQGAAVTRRGYSRRSTVMMNTT